VRTAVDSSVLWCLITHETAAPAWDATLRRAAGEGELVVCPVVFAELAPAYESCAAELEDLERLTIRYDEVLPPAAHLAGETYKRYRLAGGPREYMVPDFLIGAHASLQADRLAAADRGYLRRYFPTLRLLHP
jgi:predicted nucleic acid-binding protein